LKIKRGDDKIKKMIINYYGENYFKIQSGKLVVLIDPLKSRAWPNNYLVLITSPLFLKSKPEKSEGFLIEYQGEYEFLGVPIEGWQIDFEKGKEKTIYQLILEEIKIVVFGLIKKETPEMKKIISEIKNPEIVLALPEMAETVKAIAPKIFIPALWEKSLPLLNEVFKQKEISPKEKLVVKKKDLETINRPIIECLKF